MFCDRNVFTIFLQFMHLEDPEAVVLDAEGCVNHISYVVVQHPAEGGEQVGVH